MKFLPSRLFWIEKLTALVDFFQLFAILWITSQPWPWPTIWVSWTQWTVAFNLDFFSLTADGALLGQTSNLISQWGQMSGYLTYSLIYGGFSLLIFILIQITSRLSDVYGKRYDVYQPYILGGLYYFAYFFYVPQLLSLCRLFYCEQSGFLSADINVSCSSSNYAVALTFTLLMSLPLTIYFPFLIYHIITEASTYKNPADHEKQIQIYELMHLLDVDSEWIRNHVYVLSSFTQHGAFYYLHMMIFKVLMLIFFISVRANYIAQSLCMWIVTVTFLVHYGFFYLPFRHWTSNAINCTLLSMLFIGLSFGVVNTFNVQNGIMVNSVQSLWMLVFYFFGFVVMSSVVLYCLLAPGSLDLTINPPCIETLCNIQKDERYCNKVWKWIFTLKQGYKTRFDFVMSSNVIADIYSLEESIRQLHKYWLQAKYNGSIFTTPIGELLEDLLELHSSRSPKCLRRHRHWNEAYMECVQHDVFKKRHYKYILMTSQKRRILMKIFAIRVFSKGSEKKLELTNVVFNSKNRRLSTLANTACSPKIRSAVKSKRKIETSTRICEEEDTQQQSAYSNEDDEDEEEIDDEVKMYETIEAIKTLEALSFSKLDHYNFHETATKNNDDVNSSIMSSSNDGRDDSNNDVKRMEEIRKLDEMFTSWNKVIQSYENEDLPGYLTFSAAQVEDWYTLRAALSTQLELLYIS